MPEVKEQALQFVKLSKFAQCPICGVVVTQVEIDTLGAFVIPLSDNLYVFAHSGCWDKASPDRPWQEISLEEKREVGRLVAEAQ
jgi:hypothetical protein